MLIITDPYVLSTSAQLHVAGNRYNIEIEEEDNLFDEDESEEIEEIDIDELLDSCEDIYNWSDDWWAGDK